MELILSGLVFDEVELVEARVGRREAVLRAVRAVDLLASICMYVMCINVY